MTKILVIDDDALVRDLIAHILEIAGYLPVLASNGREGIARFKSDEPALVITDILMPEKEGIETILDIRRLRQDVKIIAISGGGVSGAVEFLDMAAKLGASAAIAKPFKPAALISMVAQLLG